MNFTLTPEQEQAQASFNAFAQQEIAPFDMVFVDADKTRLIEYVEACLSSDRLLNRGGKLSQAVNAIGRGREASQGSPFELTLR